MVPCRAVTFDSTWAMWGYIAACIAAPAAWGAVAAWLFTRGDAKSRPSDQPTVDYMI